ncbi:hypothetical protein [Pengzhenrongella sp.]|uniref:nSTAND1 domain-containing NTPase n=1 Tax=Pengzhenrongella sp. TaxID=2888820 RepID=UPI002F9431FF
MTSATLPPARAPHRPPGEVPACPYVGLMPFDEADSEYFFGRERERDLIIANLTAVRLTLLYSASGVGKSSVLRAGVLPLAHELAAETFEDLGTPGAVTAYVSDWSGDPLRTVASAVLVAVETATDAASLPDAVAEFSVQWLRATLESSDILAIHLILDQFEEYFLYHPEDVGGVGLIGELGQVLSARDLPVNVLLSIREDALAGLDRFKGRIPHLFDNYLRLAPLDRVAARTAIEGPLAHYNDRVEPDARVQAEPALIDLLLDQVRLGSVIVTSSESPSSADQADTASVTPQYGTPDRAEIETPYLQLVLTRLWHEERAIGSSILRRETLDRLGGAQAIVRSHLDEVMAGLSQDQLDVAAGVFHHLVTTSGSKIALTADDLAEWSGVGLQPVRQLLEALSSGRRRILRPVPPPVGTTGPPRYEIYHDVMGAAVLDWRRRYVAHLERLESERQLIEEREGARVAAVRTRARLHRTRLVVAGMALVVVAMAFLTVLSYQSSRDAEQRRMLAAAAEHLDAAPGRSLAEAVDAYGISADAEARQAVLTAASAPRGRVVAGPRPEAVGMLIAPHEHIVTFDANGAVTVLSSEGTILSKTPALKLSGRVSAGSINVDATRLAVETDLGEVEVIDLVGGDAKRIRGVGSAPVFATFVGSSGGGLVVSTYDGKAEMYDVATGSRRFELPHVAYEVLAVSGGRRFVTSDDDARLRVWDAGTGKLVEESGELPGSASFLRNYGDSVVALNADDLSAVSLLVWDWKSGSAPHQYPVQYPGGGNFNGIQDTTLDNDQGTVMISVDKTVLAYSLSDGRSLWSLPSHADWVYGASAMPNSRWIATAGGDGRVVVWSLYTSGSPTYQLLGHKGYVAKVAFIRDGAAVVSLGVDGTVRMWELPRVKRLGDAHSDWVLRLDASGDKRWLVSMSSAEAIVMGRNSLKDAATLNSYDVGTELDAVLFDPLDPHRLVVLPRYWRAPQIWSWKADGTTKAGVMFGETPSVIASIAISPDGRTVAGGDWSGQVHLWDAHTGKLEKDPGYAFGGSGIEDVAFSPTGHHLAAVSADGVRIWDLSGAHGPIDLDTSKVSWAVFSPTGDRLATVAEGGVVDLWDATGRRLEQIAMHGGRLGRPAFSDDGRLLAAGTAEGLIQVVEVASGDTVMLSRVHGDSVNSLLFEQGKGTALVSASDDYTVARSLCPACDHPDAVIRDAQKWVRDNPVKLGEGSALWSRQKDS